LRQIIGSSGTVERYDHLLYGGPSLRVPLHRSHNQLMQRSAIVLVQALTPQASGSQVAFRDYSLSMVRRNYSPFNLNTMRSALPNVEVIAPLSVDLCSRGLSVSQCRGEEPAALVSRLPPDQRHFSSARQGFGRTIEHGSVAARLVATIAAEMIQGAVEADCFACSKFKSGSRSATGIRR
jgi:hypothetical protein